ncbi:MAG TPA: YbhN family protein [Acidimicrobiia bacterium]|nr:YbhN family protein [Acidimicrobiia bacterium]
MESAEAPASTPSLRRRITSGLISLVLVVAIFVGVFPRIASYDAVWRTIADMTWLDLSGVAALAALNLFTYLLVLTAVLPGLRYREAFVANNSSTAVANTVPAGAAIGIGVNFAMYRSWGFDNGAIALSILVSGLWNVFLKLGLPIVAVVLLVIGGEADTSLVSASLVGVVVLTATIVLFALALRSDRLANGIGHALSGSVNWLRARFHRPPVGEWGRQAVVFRDETAGLLESRWLRITAAILLSHLTLYLVLLVTLRAVGVSEAAVSWAQVLAAFAFGRLLTALPLTPGGLGLIELGYTAALSVGVDEMTRNKIVAAVLVFRALTYLTPIFIGGVTYLVWLRNRSWRRPVGSRADHIDPGGPARGELSAPQKP